MGRTFSFRASLNFLGEGMVIFCWPFYCGLALLAYDTKPPLGDYPCNKGARIRVAAAVGVKGAMHTYK